MSDESQKAVQDRIDDTCPPGLAKSDERFREVVIRSRVRLVAPLDLRSRWGLTLKCCEDGALIAAFPNLPDDVKWPLIDCTGSAHLRLSDLILEQEAGTTAPGVGILPARLLDGRSSNCHLIERLVSFVPFSTATVYNLGSECGELRDSRIGNGVGACYYTCAWNPCGVTSPLGPFAGQDARVIGGPGAVSNVVFNIQNCPFSHWGKRACVVIQPNGGAVNLLYNSFNANKSLAAIYIGHDRRHLGRVPMYGGYMAGNYSERGGQAAGVVLSADWEEGDEPNSWRSYPDIERLNPMLRGGVLHVGANQDFPHP